MKASRERPQVSITLSRRVLEVIDRKAETEDLPRSRVISNALQDVLLGDVR